MRIVNFISNDYKRYKKLNAKDGKNELEEGRNSRISGDSNSEFSSCITNTDRNRR